MVFKIVFSACVVACCKGRISQQFAAVVETEDFKILRQGAAFHEGLGHDSTQDKPELMRQWRDILEGANRHGLFHSFTFQYSIMMWWEEAFHATFFSLLHSLPFISHAQSANFAHGVAIITITSENLYFFQDLSLINIAFHLKCSTFTFSLYIHLELNLLFVWFGKDSKVISRAQKLCVSVRKQL